MLGLWKATALGAVRHVQRPWVWNSGGDHHCPPPAAPGGALHEEALLIGGEECGRSSAEVLLIDWRRAGRGGAPALRGRRDAQPSYGAERGT